MHMCCPAGRRISGAPVPFQSATAKVTLVGLSTKRLSPRSAIGNDVSAYKTYVFDRHRQGQRGSALIYDFIFIVAMLC
jgi:hypothetical protein